MWVGVAGGCGHTAEGPSIMEVDRCKVIGRNKSVH